MNLAHLHLLLNHVPTIGTVIAIAVLFMSIVRKNEGMKRFSLELFCVIGLITVATYLSGLATQPTLEETGVAAALIQRHHDAALQASAFMVLTGFVAWLGLWRSRLASPSRLTTPTVLLLAAVTLALMGRAATMGGEIRHPEIVLAENAGDVAAVGGPPWFTAGYATLLVNETIWLFPAMEALHFIGLWVLFGVLLTVNLRLLGLMKTSSFAAVHRLLPWAALALTVNIVTGMLFVLANPGMYLFSYPFYWKMGLLLLAGATLIYQTAFDQPWEIGPGQDAPFSAKIVAASSIALWIGVMFFGRMLPFLGDAF
jgi:hypothetical protein